FAGRSLASGLLKLVPGFGTVAGAVVRGTTAATLTKALGEAYIAALRISLERSGGAALSPRAVAQVLREQLIDRMRRRPAEVDDEETSPEGSGEEATNQAGTGQEGSGEGGADPAGGDR